MNNTIEVRIDGKRTTVKVDGTYWGYDAIDDRAWHVTEQDYESLSPDDILEAVTVISKSQEYDRLLEKVKKIYPDYAIRFYKS